MHNAINETSVLSCTVVGLELVAQSHIILVNDYDVGYQNGLLLTFDSVTTGKIEFSRDMEKSFRWATLEAKASPSVYFTRRKAWSPSPKLQWEPKAEL